MRRFFLAVAVVLCSQPAFGGWLIDESVQSQVAETDRIANNILALYRQRSDGIYSRGARGVDLFSSGDGMTMETSHDLGLPLWGLDVSSQNYTAAISGPGVSEIGDRVRLYDTAYSVTYDHTFPSHDFGAVAFDNSDNIFLASWDGDIYQLDTNTHAVTLVASAVGTGFTGEGIGFVESMDISSDGDFFLSVTMAAIESGNRAAVIRVLNPANELDQFNVMFASESGVDLLADGYNTLSYDGQFSADGSVFYVPLSEAPQELSANIGALQGLTAFSSAPNALGITGMFGGDFSGNLVFASESGVPEPSTWLLLACGLLGLVHRRPRIPQPRE